MYNSSNIKQNLHENLDKSNPFFYLSQYVISPFRFKTNHSNNDHNEFAKFTEDLNRDYLQNSLLKILWIFK